MKPLRFLGSPSARAALLFRIAARGGWRGRIARTLLITLHSCDVAPGAAIGRGLLLPHPIGIVVGRGVTIGNDVKVWQHVTLGTDADGRYPTIGDEARLLPGSVIVGGVEIGARATVGALALVRSDVAPDGVVSAPSIRSNGSGRSTRFEEDPA